MASAVHTSSVVEKDGKVHYVGVPTGFVVRLEDGRAIYFAGDTALFGDMRLIARALRAGDRVPADRRSLHDGPRCAAAKACEMLGVRQVVPMHYGTFPALTGRPRL